jgi:GNAT superfamily N-acetyltransferase
MTAVIQQVEVTTLVRRVRPADRDALLEMFERCSRETRYRRWHGHSYRFPVAYLAALLAEDDQHLAYAAVRGDEIVGVASAVVSQPPSPVEREVAILVEDAWQRQGVGAVLLERLVRESRRRGAIRIRAEVLYDDAWLLGLLRRHGCASSSVSHGVIGAVVDLGDPRP